jgi:transketolase
MRSLPKMTVVVPADTVAVAKMLPLVVDRAGPVFFRLSRNEAPTVHGGSYAPEIGRAVLLRDGADVTLACCGLMVARCLDAAEELAGQGVQARVLELHTVKPLDVDAVTAAAEETGALVTVEEHSVIGGLGGAVAEALAARAPVPVERVGLADRFAETGPYETLLDHYGMSVADITGAAKRAVQRKE